MASYAPILLVGLLAAGCASPAARRVTSGDGTWRLLASELTNWQAYDAEPEDGVISFISDWDLGNRGSSESLSKGEGEASRWRVIDGELLYVTESFEWGFDRSDPTERRTYTFEWEDGTREAFNQAWVDKDAVGIGTESTGFVSYDMRRPL